MSLESTPKKVARRLLSPLAEFAQQEASSGILLMLCTVLAVVIANSGAAQSYADFWNTPIAFGAGATAASKTLVHWVNDGLMAVFFLLVGLEIKREVLLGQLSSVKKAALPAIAAVGGMIVPALIFTLFNAGRPSGHGWGIPMATDIAFALGVLALLGKRIPFALKVFLTAIAIVDDIGAVLVIAIFYSSSISWSYLLGALCFLLALLVANWLQVRRTTVYAVLGFGLWLMVLASGVHATVAGVLLAFTIPARVYLKQKEFIENARQSIDEFESDSGDDRPIILSEARQVAVRDLEKHCERVQMPLERISHKIEFPVTFLIVPLFALANAGVRLTDLSVLWKDSVGLGVSLGLLLGKPLGIALFSVLAVKLKIAELPKEITPIQVIGAGILAGIGFTMSLFITELAFKTPEHTEVAKVAILCGSLLAGVIGYLLLYFSKPAADRSKADEGR